MKISTRDMILISLFTALTTIGAFLSIPIGEVPISLQTMFVLLSGIILGPKLAPLSQIVYISLGLVGLRIFAGFKGGPQMIFSPTFGFLLGFILASFIVGIIIHNLKVINFINILLACLTGSLVIYLIGLPYMYIILNKVMNIPISFIQTLKTGCLIFIPGDILKSILASFVGLNTLNRLDIEKMLIK